ncbi:MAG: hypothetical protein JXM68_01405 [Sedimentisphaerales bacterium]|nr:hypothetical protein [Sedimentisphaerales bacterium]
MNLRLLLTFICLFICNGSLLAQEVVEDQDTPISEPVDDYIDYETSPIYGNSSSRGVSYFSVPGQAAVGSTSVSRFARYSTGVSNLMQPDAVRSRNPLAYSRRLPLSVYGAIPQMPDQVRTRISSRFTATKAVSLNDLFKRANVNPELGFAQKSSPAKAATEILENIMGRAKSYSASYAGQMQNNALLQQMNNSNVSRLFDRKKVLLLGNRSGRLSYTNNDMRSSLLNRTSRVYAGKKLSAEYNTSAILNR